MTRDTRLNNLKNVVKLKQNVVQLPGFKKHEIPDQYAVLYAHRDQPSRYETMHLVDRESMMAMIEREIYYQAAVFDLDTGEMVVHRVRECPCHGKNKHA